jgi:predicted SnoaL-like aldol condensation-catalyzing enzyme
MSVMIEIVNPSDARAVRNKDNVLALYDAMINRKNTEEGVNQFLEPNYIQHNPLVPDGAAGLAGFFGKMTKERANLRVVVHRIIAAGDYVWAHVNFINLFNDDPQDRGIAGVDIYKMNSDGKAVEHWDVLQEVGDPKKAAHTNGMF